MAENHETMALSPGHPLNGERVLRISRSANILKVNTQKRIGTWNVQSMFQTGKVANTIKEMRRLKVDILGVSEMRWPGSGECEVDEHKIYYAGENSVQHRNGVAILVTKEINRAVLGFLPVSDRVAMIKINAKPFKLNVIQVYAPTSDSSDDDLEQFYTDIKKVLKQTRKELHYLLEFLMPRSATE